MRSDTFPVSQQDVDHSAATTVASSPRLQFHGDDNASSSSASAKWRQVRDVLVKAALDGDEVLHGYGDLITCKDTIERFLAGAKGNVEKASKQLQAHLVWRQEYQLDHIVSEDFSDLEARGELYWGGHDLEGVPTLTWLIGKHVPANQCPKRFVRFFVYQIEKGLRTSPHYPNSMFNIFVELTNAGLHSIDGQVAALLQPILMRNYPKVRKGMFVFPVNWFVQLCWNTVLKPLISSLQPDIEDKICPLYGDFRPQLFARFSPEQVEIAFGGNLNLAESEPPTILPYKSMTLDAVLESQRSIKVANVSALHEAQYLDSEKRAQVHAATAMNDSCVHFLGSANVVKSEAAHVKPDSSMILLRRHGSWVMLFSVLYCFLVWGGNSWWINGILGICTVLLAVKYTRTGIGLDGIIEDGKIQDERDHDVLLYRLERERFREASFDPVDSNPRGGQWGSSRAFADDSCSSAGCTVLGVVEWGAEWLGDYAARCGM